MKNFILTASAAAVALAAWDWRSSGETVAMGIRCRRLASLAALSALAWACCTAASARLTAIR